MVILSSIRKNRNELYLAFCSLFLLNLSFTSQSISILHKDTSPRLPPPPSPASHLCVCELSRFLAVPMGPDRDWLLLSSPSTSTRGFWKPPGVEERERTLRSGLGLITSSAPCDLWKFLGLSEPETPQLDAWHVIWSIKLVPLRVVSLYFPPPVTYRSTFSFPLPFKRNETFWS